MHKVVTDDFAKHQCSTSVNWSVGSNFWLHAVGGLNYQIEHHLFPCLVHSHYPAMSDIVRKTCKEFDVPYNDYPSFTALVIDHFQFLKSLGAGKKFH
jgi:linoleoyl-CoA desaturase